MSAPVCSHNVVVIIDTTRYRIADDYCLELTCTAIAGWRLWKHDITRAWDKRCERTLLGGEFDGGSFRIEVAGQVICASEEGRHD